MSVTRVLIVEDNPDDVMLLRFAFKKDTEWRTELAVARDGEEAIEHLRSPDKPRPALVILDLNLPKVDGVGVLKVIRTEPALDSLAVIVFSSSPEDVMRSKVLKSNAGADGYIAKPCRLESYFTLTQQFRKCWESRLQIT